MEIETNNTTKISNTRKSVFIDGDGCNAKSRELVERLAEKNIQIIIVANREIPCSNPNTTMYVSDEQPDAADNYIVTHITEGDLLISRDLILASRVLALGGYVMSDSGEQYYEETIAARIIRSQHSIERRAGLVMSEKEDSTSKISNSSSPSRKTKDVKKDKKSHQTFANLIDKWVNDIL